MSAYVSKTVDLTTDDSVVVPVNGRWVEGNFSIVASFAGTGTINVQGTISKINRGEPAVWFDITGLTGVATDVAQNIANTPLEALKVEGVTMAGGGAQVQILQTGSC